MNPIRLDATFAGLILAGICLSSCSDGGDSAGGDDRAEMVARARTAALFADEKYADAERELAPLLERSQPAAQDLVWAAILELVPKMEPTDLERTAELLARANAAAPDAPEVEFMLGVLAERELDFEKALGHFRRTHELAPGDYPAHLRLANTLFTLDRFEEAIGHYEDLLEVGLDFSGSWYMTTLFRMAGCRQQLGDDEGWRELMAEYTLLNNRGITVPESNDLDRGNLGDIRAPGGIGNLIDVPEPPAKFDTELARVTEVGEVRGIFVASRYADWAGLDDGGREVPVTPIPPPSIVTFGPGGAWMVGLSESNETSAQLLIEGAIDLLEGLDIDEDGDLDWVVARGDTLELYVDREGRLERSGVWTLPGSPTALLGIDYNHEGFVDLVVAGAFGARLFLNVGDEAEGARTFEDATDTAGLSGMGATAWVLAEDFDTDQDVDLLFGRASGLFLADNLRGGEFADASERVASLPGSTTAPLVADFDGDARPDLWFTGAEPVLAFGQPSGSPARSPGGTAPAAPVALATSDIDADGALDALWSSDGELGARMALGTPVGIDAKLGELEAGALALGDINGDGHVELLAGDAGGLAILGRSPAAAGNALHLALKGIKDNDRGRGAIVELLAGNVYRRVFWGGEPQHLGLGGHERADVLRVTWPNGVVQYELDLSADEDRVIIQKEGLIGSCPFLYTWNGEEFVFISDVLGITPLGLPMAPGILVPPDHDEFVLIRGDQLAARDGVFEMQVTEELREVTYLDRVRLDVLDHPAGSEVYPDERFCFPPFPEAHTHTTVDPLSAVRVVGSDGQDWTGELARIDGEYAAPFTPRRGAFQGLATAHHLEFTFDAEAVRNAPRLRLFMTGWFYWTDASVNVAAARTPGVDFLPPVLRVPDGEGGWKDTGPPVGFPAGKTKTMVIDVTGLIDPEDPRLRVASTLRLYWDAIRLGVDADDAPLVVTRLEPRSAELWERGYSEAQEVHAEYGLEWFTWDLLERQPRWDQHPGMYTRFGECVELLGDADDRFVIMGSGDALRLRFDASELPPPPDGYVRDYLLYMDGWAKDRDPNTVEALNVEPLPFHGMSAYPYGEGEHFPDDELHREWRRTWNTRPARRWIPPLAPGASRRGPHPALDPR